jgi:hypothetical protein
MAQYVAWCAPGQSLLAFYTQAPCRQLYQAYVTYVLNRVNTYNGRRYKDDPTVFAWELANEPDLPDNLDRSGQAIRAWVAEMAAFLKALDGNHLVGTGEVGGDVTTAGYSPLSAYNNQAWFFDGTKGTAFSQNTADPHVDFGSVHVYPEFWNMSATSGQTWIADHARIARGLGKPLLVGEFGASQNAAATYTAWLQTAETEQVGGSLQWQLMCPSCFGMRDQFGVAYPPASDVSGVLAQAAGAANSRSVVPPAPPAPPAPPGAPTPPAAPGTPGAPGAPPPPSVPGAGGLPLGVYVATADVDGNGVAELITGPDAGGAPHVRILRADGSDTGQGVLAYDPGFRGGVRVAACDVDGDGRAEIVTGAGFGGGSHVRVFKLVGTAVVELAGFLAYDPGFRGGVYVACGDVDGDGRGELIVGAGGGGGPHVGIFRVAGDRVVPLASFLAFDPAFIGGIRVAAGDLDGDGRAEIVVGAGPGGGPHVRVFALAGDSAREVVSFFAYGPTFAGGVFVAAGAVAGGGAGGIVTGPDAGGGPHVRVFTGAGAELGPGFLAFDPAFGGGVHVAAVSLAGSAYQVVAATGPGLAPRLRTFRADGSATGIDLLAY